MIQKRKKKMISELSSLPMLFDQCIKKINGLDHEIEEIDLLISCIPKIKRYYLILQVKRNVIMHELKTMDNFYTNTQHHDKQYIVKIINKLRYRLEQNNADKITISIQYHKLIKKINKLLATNAPNQ